MGVRIRTLKWEDDARPAIATDAQAVVNEQLLNDVDIFVGILWSRFGSPTPRAGSGTEEEFRYALERHRANPGSIRVLVYRKTAPVPIDQIDTKQYELLIAFLKKVRNAGVLVKEFMDAESLEKLLRLHLATDVRSLLSSHEAGHTRTQVEQTGQECEADDERGLIELIDEFEGEMSGFDSSMTRMTSFTAQLNSTLTKRTAEVHDLQAAGITDRRAIKRVLDSAGDDLLSFANSLDAESDVMTTAFERAMDAIAMALAMPELQVESNGDLSSLRNSIAEAKTAAANAIGQLRQMKEQVDQLPQMTSRLVRARRVLRSALEKVLSGFGGFVKLLDEALVVIEDRFEGAD